MHRVMNELASRESIQVIFLGGILRRVNMSFYRHADRTGPAGPARRQAVFWRPMAFTLKKE